ncbi:hypothetical protein [Leptolyngbya sp. FACHB-261]|uniref:hypothetical protein n=1 Tax=Leptolyngbya sp. FACHB-261 TaxID=2692806 RepID=UPI0016851CD4|nr:hypothetical protein [Leptolyngbya sp. FACHB-261]MBD2104740.1 hypothetical protein [Leptolyngbya sp. FACHB-261]
MSNAKHYPVLASRPAGLTGQGLISYPAAGAQFNSTSAKRETMSESGVSLTAAGLTGVILLGMTILTVTLLPVMLAVQVWQKLTDQD